MSPIHADKDIEKYRAEFVKAANTAPKKSGMSVHLSTERKAHVLMAYVLYHFVCVLHVLTCNLFCMYMY